MTTPLKEDKDVFPKRHRQPFKVLLHREVQVVLIANGMKFYCGFQTFFSLKSYIFDYLNNNTGKDKNKKKPKSFLSFSTKG